MNDELDLADLAPREITIKVKGVPKYILKEASADAAAKYRNATLKGASIDQVTKKVTPGEMANGEAIVVAACLFEIWDENKSPRPVLLSTVLGWRCEAVSQLFDKVVAMSPGLMLTDNSSKNVQSAATATSV